MCGWAVSSGSLWLVGVVSMEKVVAGGVAAEAGGCTAAEGAEAAAAQAAEEARALTCEHKRGCCIAHCEHSLHLPSGSKLPSAVHTQC
jgi:hypothetical protein